VLVAKVGAAAVCPSCQTLAVMKFTCPHCQGSGVSLVGKLFSAPYSPAKCRLCGGLSAESAIPNRVLSAGHTFLPFVAAYYALMWHSWFPVLVYLGFAISAPFLLLPILPLHAVGPADARRNYRRHAVAILALVSVFLVFALWSEFPQ